MARLICQLSIVNNIVERSQSPREARGLEFGLFRSPNVGGLYKMTRSWYKLRL